MNGGWSPDPEILRNTETIGGVTDDGRFQPPDGRGGFRSTNNNLMHSDNPIVRRIGAFCSMTPNIDVGMAVFSGFFLALRVAQRHPERVTELFKALIDVGPNGEIPLDDPAYDAVDAMVDRIMDDD